MSETELLVMKGYLDIVLGSWLMRRFLAYSSEFGFKLRFAQVTIISFLLLILQLLGVWHWNEVVTAFKFLPVVWPLLLVILYLAYQNYLLSQTTERAEFEIDWRREYQEVLIQELEGRGKEIPPPPERKN
ncbi:MAG: hypothetical protein HY819_20135 [Acidobacteria bacterium]|nr:hypothetical protein [Acidobacteriota bacterium]